MRKYKRIPVIYILIEVNGKKKFELDKLNFVYKVNDVDLLAKVRKLCEAAGRLWPLVLAVEKICYFVLNLD